MKPANLDRKTSLLLALASGLSARQAGTALGIPEKQLHRWLENWGTWWEYGVNALAGWLTPEGKAEAARRRASGTATSTPEPSPPS